jgi:putative addiction module component (TIGR02574 family)
MTGELHKQILLLNRDERLRLVQYIIDSIRYEAFVSEPEEHDEAQMQELDRRMKSIDEGRAEFVDWAEIKAGLGKP